MKGVFNACLAADLNSKSTRVIDVPPGVYKHWLSGRGLATYLLLQRLNPKADPLSENNVLVLTPGIAAGAVPGTSRYSIHAKSPLTNAYGESYSGGSLAPAFKAAGYDALVLEGACKRPTYLVVTPEGVSFEDAAGIWGLTTYEAEEAVLREVGEKNARALTIGPAGENLVRFACINNDRWRNAGRCGLGAVMGSKNLKAIVFYGRREPEFGDAAGLKGFSRRLAEKGRGSRGVRSFRRYGTLNMAGVLNHLGGFPTRYWTSGKSDGIERINAEYLVRKMDAKPKACYNCFIACGKLATVKKGRHKGLKIEGPEYETAFAFGGLCAIESLEEVAYLNDLCDSLGLDTITAGSVIALGMEAGSRGLSEHRLEYGDAEGAAELLRDIAYKKGHGRALSEGVKPAGEKLGVSDLAMHVKGLDLPGYDPRLLRGMSLAYGTSPRGACHLRSAYYRAELGGKSPEKPEEKARQFITYEDSQTLFDSIIMCKFYGVITSGEDLRELVGMLTGIKYSPEELRGVADRIVRATREFNLRAGLGSGDDALPRRLHSEPLGGKTLPEREYREMLQAYYKLRNWDGAGRPKN